MNTTTNTTTNISPATRLTDDLERQLLAAAFEEQDQIHPVRFIKRVASAVVEMSRDLVAARAKGVETQLV